MLTLRKAFRIFGFVALGLVLLVLCALLLVRFYFAPNIERWQADIQLWVQQDIHPGLRFAQVAIDWQGIEPELSLAGVEFLNEAKESEGTVKHLTLQVDWWGLFSGQVKINQVSLDQAQLIFRRDKDGFIRMADEIVLHQPTPQAVSLDKEPLLNTDVHAKEQHMKQWLEQILDVVPQTIHISNSQLIWRDELRHSPDLVLDQLQIHLQQNYKGLQLEASITPPVNLAEPIHLKANVNRKGQGQAQFELGYFYPQTLRHWLDTPLLVEQGYMSEAQVHLQIANAQISQFQLNGKLHDFVLHEEYGEPALDIRADAMDVQIASDNGLDRPYRFSFATSNLTIKSEEFFRHPLNFYGAQGKGVYLKTSGGLSRIEFSQFRSRLPTGAVNASGSWQVDPYSENGILDLEANIDFLALVDLPKYLPKVIDADSLDWLEGAFEGGRIEQAKIKINGVVDHIPFGRRTHSGDFHIQGTVKDVVLNYHQFPDKAGLSWPKLKSPEVKVDFDADNILIEAEQVQIQGIESIRLNQLRSQVAHIEKDTAVSVQAAFQAQGQDFLTFYQGSPLKRILDGALDQSRLTGNLQGTIAIDIPITDVDATKVRGEVALTQGNFQFEPIYPELRQAQGDFVVTENNLSVTQLKGELLGGNVDIKGGVGSKGDQLSLRGEFSAQGLREFLPLKGLQRIKGRSAYQVQLDFLGQDKINMSMSSQLKGTAFVLPGALAKEANQSVLLKVDWVDRRPKGTRQLLINYGDGQVRGLFERIDKTPRFFHRGVIAVNRAPDLPKTGLSILSKGGQWDLQAWKSLSQEFDTPIAATKSTGASQAKTNGQGESIPTFPILKQLDLQMDRMDFHRLRVEDMHLKADRQDDRNWQVQVQSPDMQGQVQVVLSENLQDIESLKGTYDHLYWRDKNKNTSNTDDTADISNRLDLPDIDVQVNKLNLYDHELGALNIKGTHKSKEVWQLKELTIHNDVGSLFATGQLNSDAQNTRADIHLNINALEMGKFLTYFGIHDVMRGGSGFINGRIKIPDLNKPSLNDLQADWEGQVVQGSLLSVKSKAVKTLEFISLQSISRLAQASNGHSIFGEGLPFDYIRGTFSLNQQRLQVADFRLDGPVIAVVAMGDTNLATRKLNFQAVAVPKIEMSGAAILSGIIVNPIIGVGAFLTQWLLKDPLGRALAQYFHITGTWDEPKLDDVALPSEEQLKEKDAQRKIDDLYRN